MRFDMALKLPVFCSGHPLRQQFIVPHAAWLKARTPSPARLFLAMALRRFNAGGGCHKSRVYAVGARRHSADTLVKVPVLFA